MVLEGIVVTIFGAIVSVTGYGAKKVLDIDKRQAAHEAADKVQFETIHLALTELKTGLTAGNEKLDRLVEGMLARAESKPRLRKR